MRYQDVLDAQILKDVLIVAASPVCNLIRRPAPPAALNPDNTV